jgi:hypothetical protein
MKTRFGLYLAAIFCPPLYFFIQKKPLVATIHTILWLIALPLTFFVVGFFLWFLLMIHAAMHLALIIREDTLQRQAEILHAKMSSTAR